MSGWPDGQRKGAGPLMGALGGTSFGSQFLSTCILEYGEQSLPLWQEEAKGSCTTTAAATTN